MTRKISQMEINQELFSEISQKVGENQGRISAIEDRLEAIDARVAHNCQRNEDNFKLMENKLDQVSQQIIGFFAGQQARVDTLQTEFKAQNELVHKLQKADTKKQMVIYAIVVLAVLGFIGGSAINWESIKSYFDNTSMQERAGIVKDAIQTIK